MKPVYPNIHLANRMIIANVWLLHDARGRRFLIDTGHAVERLWLKRSLWQAGVRGKGDLQAVLLTHRHSDHAGNAAWVRKIFDCPVICHPGDAAFLRGENPPPRLARGQARFYEEVLCHIEDRFPARSPVDETYATIELELGFRVWHTPGHTEGSVMLYHEDSQVLFSGDSILAGPPTLRWLEWLRLVRPGFSLDVDQCRREIRKCLLELPPVKALCAGHGPLVGKEADLKLRRLLR
jgi:glyoxylase-like metal-dependent hydrolase (beta-lactamase superfamily II)